MLRNKAGQKSLIVNAMRQENIGLIVIPVRLLGHYKSGDSLEISGERFTVPITDNFWLVESPLGVETLFGQARQAYIADTWLKPYIDPVVSKSLSKVESA